MELIMKWVMLAAGALNFGVQAGVGAVQPFAEPFSPKLGYYVGLGIQWNF